MEWSDRKYVLEAVKRDGYALRHAEELRGDSEIVLEAVRKDGTALRFASKNLQDNHEIVLEADMLQKIFEVIAKLFWKL